MSNINSANATDAVPTRNIHSAQLPESSSQTDNDSNNLGSRSNDPPREWQNLRPEPRATPFNGPPGMHGMGPNGECTVRTSLAHVKLTESMYSSPNAGQWQWLVRRNSRRYLDLWVIFSTGDADPKYSERFGNPFSLQLPLITIMYVSHSAVAIGGGDAHVHTHI